MIGIVLCLGAASLSAEPLPLTQLQHKSWTAIDGAPSHELFLAQGADGLLWISTIDGLYRFDGIKFAPFRLPEGISPTANTAYSLRVSSSGALFAGSFYEGIVTTEHGRIWAFGARDGLPHAPISSMSEGPDHRMWCAAGGRLLRFDGNRWNNMGDETNLPRGVADTLFFDRHGTLWVATNSGMLYYLPAGQHSFEISREAWDPSLGIVGLVEGPEDSLWLGLQDLKGQHSIIRQLNVVGHPATGPIRLEFPYSIWDLHFDRSGALWLTGKGVRRITFSASNAGTPGSQVLHILNEETMINGLSSAATKYICEDNDNDIWISTLRGIERFRTPALVAVAPPATELADSPDVAAGIDGRVWIHAAEPRISAFEGRKLVATGPKALDCFDLFEDRTGALWYSDRKALLRFAHGRSLRVPVPSNLSVRRIMQIAQLPNGSMLFLFADLGLWEWDAGTWSHLSPSVHTEGQITAVLPEKAHVLWLGYASGLVATWDPVARAPYQVIGQSTLGTVYAFLDTHFGFLVSGNRGVALLQHNSFKRLAFRANVDIVGVSGMILSSKDDLWLNSEHGVAHVPRAELEREIVAPSVQPLSAEVFSEPEIQGPARLLFDLPTVARDATGRLWFNTSDTIAFIDPAHIVRNTVAPVLTVSSISADGHAIGQPFKIPPGNHTIRIEYFGSNLTAPEKVRYRYKLDGVDDNWQDVGSRTEAVYTRLRPGRYAFHVIASNGESVSSQAVAITFIVLPTFYQTGWFLALCVAATIAIATLVYRMRIQSMANRLRDRAEEGANERIRIARDLHDTLLQGFQGLMLSFHVAAQAVPNDARARALLESALSKADRLVVEGRDRVNRLRSESLEGVSLPDALRALGQELDTHNSIAFEVQVTQSEIELEPHVKDELFCIAREAVTNSFHHADAQIIGVTLDFGKRVFTMICFDDGRGIDLQMEESASQFHYGMLGMRERARRLKAHFLCESSPGHGTKVTARLLASRAYIRRGPFAAFLRYFRRHESTQS